MSLAVHTLREAGVGAGMPGRTRSRRVGRQGAGGASATPHPPEGAARGLSIRDRAPAPPGARVGSLQGAPGHPGSHAPM